METLSVVEPDALTDAGLNEPDAPDGSPLTLNVTVPLPCEEPKFDPVIVTAAPTAPVVIDKLEMLGAGTTVKLEPLLSTPLA